MKTNTLKTIYFNFKVLPFTQAIKFPIHIYGKVEFANIRGNFIIASDSIKFGMIVFGGKHEIVISSNIPTRIYNTGKIIFNGEAKFARGINIMVWKNGELIIGNNFSLGSLSRIICFRKIRIGNNVLMSWEVQIVDTDFHFIVLDDIVSDNCGEVLISDNVWIGSRCSVLKKTILPENTIVGSDSLCSGNYLEKYGDSILLVGSPAKMLKKNISYLKDKKKEMELLNYFNLNKNQKIKCQN
jgi:acetyltransferase-like isoleucine patch superfamily enzyme